MIRCEIWPDGNYDHVQQVFTGLVELHKKGTLRLIQRFSKASPNRARRWTGLRAVVDGKKAIYYDLFDGPAINQEALRQADFYFKRSCSREAMRADGRVLPLGLNYFVVSKGVDIFRLRRVMAFGGVSTRLRGTVKALCGLSFPTVDEFGAPPNFNCPPRVVFMTRVYDLRGTGSKADMQRDERLNSTRVELVKLLRREFGSQFYGGIMPDSFAMERFREAVLLDKRAFDQRAYFAALRDCAICVATKGLWRSIGWKFGEYVSLSKAVLTEPLDYEVPGDLENERNYLRFVTPEQCVEAAIRLLKDRELRRDLMMNNYRYYHGYLRPDKLVLNCLMTALGSGVAN